MRRIRKRQSYGFRGVGSSFRSVLRELQQTRERLDRADRERSDRRDDETEPRPVRRSDEPR